MKPYLFIGDLHGKQHIIDKVLPLRHQYDIIFLGDYLDSFDKEESNASSEGLLKIINYAARGEVTALIGNHEASYLYYPQCSGYNRVTANKLHEHEDILRDTLKFHMLLENDVLVTHAGLTTTLVPKNSDPYDILEHNDIKFNVGYPRGGYGIGGILWCDYWKEFEPIEGIRQVFGHTAFRPGKNKGIHTYDNLNFNCDCLDTKEEYLTYNPQTSVFTIKQYEDL